MVEDWKQKLRIAEGAGWQLGIKEEFNQLVGSRPELVPTVLKLLTAVKNFNEPCKDDDVVLTQLEHVRGSIYRLEIGNQTFFLKTENHRRDLGGFHEIEGSMEAQTLLKDLTWVEIVDLKLGFSNRQYDFFISRWLNLPRLGDYLRNNLDNQQLYSRLVSRVEQVKAKLQEFYDVEKTNMFYDAEHDKIILFDLRRKTPQHSQSFD